MEGNFPLTAPMERNNNVRVMDVVYFREEEVSENVAREGGGSTDDVVRGPIKLFLQVDDGERHAEKVDGVASPGQPAAEKSTSRSKFNRSWQRQGGCSTHPERNMPHCVQVRPARTSSNGLARSAFSLFGMRFRRKYGAIGDEEEEGERSPKL